MSGELFDAKLDSLQVLLILPVFLDACLDPLRGEIISLAELVQHGLVTLSKVVDLV